MLPDRLAPPRIRRPRELRLWRTVAASLFGFALLAASPDSHGQQPENLDQAKTYFQAGAQAYAVGQYTVAVQAFEQAWALAPRPAILFSMAQALRRQYFVDRKQENLERSINLFRQYVEMVPEGGRKVDAVQALSELEPMAAHLAPGQQTERLAARPHTRVMITSTTPGAKITFDGGDTHDSPFIGEALPGQHRVSVAAPGFFDEERVVVAVEGELVALDVPMRERPAALRLIAAEGTILSIDGRYQGTAPFETELELPAGKHLITLSRPGFVGVSREVTLPRGVTTWARSALPRSPRRSASLLMMGASASSLVAGGVFAYLARGRDQAAKSFLDRRGSEPMDQDELDQYQTARTDRDSFRKAAYAAVGLSAVLGVAGGMLYLLDTPVVPAGAPARGMGQGTTRVGFTPGGLTVTGSF